MSNYNKVLLMGRLTKDLELRYTQQGTAVGTLGLAVNREFTVKDERRKETAFVDVTIWGRQAEIVNKFLKKGAPIFIEGRLSLDTWESPDGQKKSRLKVVCENFQFIGGPKGGGGGEAEGYGSGPEEAMEAGPDSDAGAAPGSGARRRGDWADTPPRQGSPRFSREPSGPGSAGRGAPPSPPSQEGPEDNPLGLDDGETPF